jgi:hypothetical protein
MLGRFPRLDNGRRLMAEGATRKTAELPFVAPLFNPTADTYRAEVVGGVSIRMKGFAG